MPLFIDVRPLAGHRGMTVGINESRFATRAWACGERVRYPTIFPKSLIRYLMTGDGIVANRGLIEMLESFNALSDYRPTLSRTNVRGRRLALATTALMSPPLHPEDCLKGKSLGIL